MNPIQLLVLAYLIGRYLRASGDPACEQAGAQMERDVEEIVEWAAGCLDGCTTWVIILTAGVLVIMLLLAILDWLLGLVGL